MKVTKQMLRNAFEAPPPRHKQDFFREIRKMQETETKDVRISGTSHRRGRISYGRFILQQAFYIKKRIWVLSFAAFAVAFIGGRVLDRDVLWLLSAMMPLLALLSVMENVRSEVYGMAELEMASRFGLKSIRLARLGMIGTLHFGVLCLVSLLARHDGVGIFQTGVYLLAPYLLTDMGSLWFVRKIRGKEAVYGAVCFAIIISILPIADQYIISWLYRAENFSWWLASLAVLSITAAYEWKMNIRCVI